jgi:hypothetical protein
MFGVDTNYRLLKDFNSFNNRVIVLLDLKDCGFLSDFTFKAVNRIFEILHFFFEEVFVLYEL